LHTDLVLLFIPENRLHFNKCSYLQGIHRYGPRMRHVRSGL
jgi:hypothetical protein